MQEQTWHLWKYWDRRREKIFWDSFSSIFFLSSSAALLGMKHSLCMAVVDPSLCNHDSFPIEETENRLQPAIHVLDHNIMFTMLQLRSKWLSLQHQQKWSSGLIISVCSSKKSMKPPHLASELSFPLGYYKMDLKLWLWREDSEKEENLSFAFSFVCP